MRRSAVLTAMFLAGVVATAPAKSKKEAPLPKIFCNARFVSVQTYEGDPSGWNQRDYPSDYNAAAGVEQRIRKWGRYTVVYTPQSVDLVFVVWRERPTGNRLPGQPTEMPPISGPRGPESGPGAPGQNPGQRGQPTMPGQGPGGAEGPGGAGVGRAGDADVGGMWPPEDQLAVYMSEGDGTLSAPLWKRAQKDGLREPKMPLFSKLADAVDDACSNSK